MSTQVINDMPDEILTIFGNYMPAHEDESNCEHNYEFYPCIGHLCTKCHIAYGVECVKPGCGVNHCEKHVLSYPALCGRTFANVVDDMTDDIYLLNLAHDGVTKGTDEDVRKVLAFPSLKVVEYCGYYIAENVWKIFEEEQYKHIEFVERL